MADVVNDHDAALKEIERLQNIVNNYNPSKKEPCLCGRHRKDLRDAWKHLHDAGEALSKCHFNVGEINAQHAGQAQFAMSDARRLIDRVEQGR